MLLIFLKSMDVVTFNDNQSGCETAGVCSNTDYSTQVECEAVDAVGECNIPEVAGSLTDEIITIDEPK